jgi:EAL domain-containing protein (putative c-di-GMP-specific phosphodiesterase class I)/DNA-binding SARP family transcriptional activator/AmiR/NasT family two-component response regulator
VPEAPPFEGSATGAGRLEVRLLGPLEVALATRTVHIGSPKQRAVLAVLALEAGKLVTSDTLCELVWDEDQPASPSATLQSLISRLRGALATASGGVVQAGRDVLRTREPGWVLDVEPAAVDALRFQELTSRARRRRERGEAAAAAEDLTEAIGLWRGAALVDVVDAGYLGAQATRLNAARLDALEDLAEAELAVGRPADALARLEVHVEANPLRERAWGLLMVALYRLGRQAAALRAFQQVRVVLGEELGLEPSPELSEIEQQILRHDPALGGQPASASTAADNPPRAPVRVPSVAPAGEFGDYSVVVVEDHDFQRRTVVQLLRNLGVGTVLDAPNGVEALRVLEAGSTPDVIICDIDMPGMDGVEFVARVAERNLACSVVIASGLEANVLRAVEAIGASHGLHVLAALEKPLTARRLGEVLRQYTRFSSERASQTDPAAVSRDELRDALESGELTAQFEPRIDLTTGAVRSAQVCGRWPARDGRPIPPPVFVPVLAREGLLLPYVERLVAESCALLDEARRAGLDVPAPLRVALNLSVLPMADPSLADRIAQMVQSRGRDPRRFVCEVDDVDLARAPTVAFSVLTRLRVKGFGLSMNHAGAGPSWTHQLDRVPVSELKLDRRLVNDAGGDPKRLAMLETALASARDMALPVVADGCDSRADLDTLLALGCSEAQGRFLAEPMPAGEMVSWAVAGYRPSESEAAR